jgi:CRP-like cAMP-binding protein
MGALKEFKKSQTVFYQGEAPTCSYRISKGLVRAYIIHENGEEATIAFFGPGDIFPIAYPFSIAPVAMFYYETVVDTVCETFRDNELMDELVQDAREELRRFAKRYAGALLHVASLAQNSAYDKVAHTLQYLAIRFGELLPDGRHYKISLRLTQHDIAKLCNISRETASIELGVLKSRDIISERNKHYIVHMDKLSAAAGDDVTTPIDL